MPREKVTLSELKVIANKIKKGRITRPDINISSKPDLQVLYLQYCRGRSCVCPCFSPVIP